MRPGLRQVLLGGGGPFLLNEDFTRYADSAVMTGKAPIVGPSWNSSGQILPTTSGGKLISPSVSGQTSYLYNFLRGIPASITSEGDITGGTDLTHKAMTIAYCSDPTFLINNTLHLNYGLQAFTLSIRQAAGSFVPVLSDSWTTAMNNDGTSYSVSMQVQGTNVVIVGPNGEQWSFSDSRVPSVAGNNVFWEPATQADGLKYSVSKAYAKRWPSFRYTNYAPFNASDLTGLTLSQGNCAATATSNNTQNQVRTVSPNQNSLVYFEVRASTIFNAATQKRGFGIATAGHSLATKLGNDLLSFGWWFGSTTSFTHNSITTNIDATAALQADQGDTIAFAINFSTSKTWCRNVTKATGWNNDVIGNQDPANGVGGNSFSTIGAGPYFITFDLQQISDVCWLNTGNLPYLGTKPAGFGNWL